MEFAANIFLHPTGHTDATRLRDPFKSNSDVHGIGRNSRIVIYKKHGNYEFVLK
jgi:hypothetical protein